MFFFFNKNAGKKKREICTRVVCGFAPIGSSPGWTAGKGEVKPIVIGAPPPISSFRTARSVIIISYSDHLNVYSIVAGGEIM